MKENYDRRESWEKEHGGAPIKCILDVSKNIRYFFDLAMSESGLTSIQSRILGYLRYAEEEGRCVFQREIEDVFVAPEGYGVKVEALTNINNNSKTLVIDIGGGTTDVAEFDEKGKFIGGKSVKKGLIDLYKEVADTLDNEYRLSVSLEDARKYFDGELSVKNDSFEEVTEYKKDALLTLGKYLLNELRGMYTNLSQYNIVLSGGGAKILHPLFLKVYPQTKAITDIKANAKGFRKVGVAKWQKN